MVNFQRILTSENQKLVKKGAVKQGKQLVAWSTSCEKSSCSIYKVINLYSRGAY